MNGEWSEALEALEQALATTRERRTARESEAFILFHLAEARLGCGDPSRARVAAEEAVAVARRRGTLVWECDAHRVLAHVLLRTDGGKSEARIREALEQAFELAERTGARSREPFIRTERAELARLLGDEAGCDRELREAHRLFSEMGATGHAERLAEELGP